MITKFAIIGGDLRMIKLAKLLAKDKKLVYTYAIEKAQELEQNENIMKSKTLQEISQTAEILIAPIPFSHDGIYINTPLSETQIKIEELFETMQNKKIIAGAISSQIQEKAQKQNIKIIDIMKQEQLTILNTIATAEGAVEVAISNTDINIQGSNILILGFGRVAKMTAKKFKLLDANVTCAARKQEDISWIEAYGYNAININKLVGIIDQYDIIINTVPQIIITKEHIKNINKECLLIDLASKPGGFDTKEIESQDLRYIWALALPGKVAPTTTAKYIKDTIYNILDN